MWCCVLYQTYSCSTELRISSRIYIYIYRVFLVVILTSCFVSLLWGGPTRTKQNMTLTGRAGGARADDNFTKKPQKKLIRYIVIFWGFSTKYSLFRKMGFKIFEKSGNVPK